MSQLLGVDVSSFNKECDFNRIRDLGKEFMLIRSSWGTNQLDSWYTKNKDKAREWGFEVGLSHTVYPTLNNPEDEAEQFYRSVSDLRAGEILIIDLEEIKASDGTIIVPYGNYDDWCVRFAKRIEEHFNGLKTLLYTNLAMINASNGFPNFRANNNGLWIASGNNNPNNPPETPWQVTAIHQYILDGDAVGMCESGKIDQDIFFGSRTQFRKYGYQPPEIPTPVPTEPPVEPLPNPIPDKIIYQFVVRNMNGQLIDGADFNILEEATNAFINIRNSLSPGSIAAVYRYNKTINTTTLLISYTKPMEPINPIPVPVVTVESLSDRLQNSFSYAVPVQLATSAIGVIIAYYNKEMPIEVVFAFTTLIGILLNVGYAIARFLASKASITKEITTTKIVN